MLLSSSAFVDTMPYLVLLEEDEEEEDVVEFFIIVSTFLSFRYVAFVVVVDDDDNYCNRLCLMNRKKIGAVSIAPISLFVRSS